MGPAKKIRVLILLFSFFFVMAAKAADEKQTSSAAPWVIPTLANEAIAKQLGWVSTEDNRCGGYYLESPFIDSASLLKKDLISVTGDQGVFSLRGTSFSEGKVTITRLGQQIIANKAYLYRDPSTGKISSIELRDHVILREPNELIIAQYGSYDIMHHARYLHGILYRTAVYSTQSEKHALSNAELQVARKNAQLSAWGKAKTFTQTQPKIYIFKEASYSTCPPLSRVWQVKASQITIDENSGRGVARNARVSVKGVPIFYTPYLNFPVDSRRQTGFLFPTFGTSGKSGASITTPFYWNIAPEHDVTVTPSYLAKRGLNTNMLFRYMSSQGSGNMKVGILPDDRAFSDFQKTSRNTFQNSSNVSTQAELRRLLNGDTTRSSLLWQEQRRFNDHWSSSINYSHVSDDYYLRDLGGNLNEVTQNQLLQEATVNYKNPHWDFLGRIQGYQTLHPLDTTVFQNQYTRLPQLILNGDYPDNKTGLNYFIENELTYFDIHNTPGDATKLPAGNRFNVQPGINLPMNWPYLFMNPRFQWAMTGYQLGRVNNGETKTPSRTIPIFDINSNLYFDRNVQLFHTAYQQTLEPQLYYVYIPYRNQSDLPVFDTTVNTLTYDQLFTYNRFSGIDRINDANQVAVGVTSRFINTESGAEKIKMGIGQIIYFQKRRVTLCDDNSCSDTPENASNRNLRSPISALLNYNATENWSVSANSIINQKSYNLDNQSVTLSYRPAERRTINLGYNFVRNGDIILPNNPSSSQNNMSQTDLSWAWPISRDWSSVARWTENWNRKRFQNLLYGLQYDSCCWAVRFIAGRIFTGLALSNTTYQYNTLFYVQFALKGLGNMGNSDPDQLLSSSIGGYQSNFGRDF